MHNNIEIFNFRKYNYFEQNLATETNYNISMINNLKSASTKNTAKLLEIKFKKHIFFSFFLSIDCVILLLAKKA